MDTTTTQPDAADTNDAELAAIDAAAEQLIADMEGEDAADAAGDGAEAKAANYGARAGQVITGRLGRGQGGRFAAAGSGGGASAAAEPASSTLRGSRAKKPKKPKKQKAAKLTPEEKAAEKARAQQANREKTFAALDLAEDATAALAALVAGQQPEGGDDGGLEKLGLAVRDGEGQLRLTPQGRAIQLAASRGDLGRARDALSLGKDRARAAAAREKARAEKEKAKQEKAKGGGGGAGSKPSKDEERAAQRQQVAQQMAAQDAGLSQPALDAMLAFADGGAGDPATLSALAAETGLVLQDSDGGHRLSPQGKRFVRAVDKGDTRGALDALSEGRDRLATAGDTMSDSTKGFLREDAHPGAMIAFLLDDATRAALLDAADMADDDEAIVDHITLVYLTPDASNLDGPKNQLVASLAGFASGARPLTGIVNGYGRFVGEGDEGDAIYVNADSPDLPGLRQRLVDIVQMCGVSFVNNHGFTPHVTLSYLESDDATPDLDIPRLPLTFDRVALVWAGEVLTFPMLGEAEEIAHGEQPEGDDHIELDDTMIYPGGAIKSLGEGRIGGYLVVYGDPSQPDLAGDFFTPETDFGFQPGERIKTAVWFNHRLPLPLKTRNGQPLVIKQQIGEGWLSRDAQGVFIEAVLDNRKQYESLLTQLGWSSGTAAHLVDREPVKGAMRITRWPLGLDASVTPTPAEPRSRAIPLKSYIPPELTLQTGQEAGLPATAGAAQKGAPYIQRSSSNKEFPVDKDELKALMGELLTAQTSSIEAKMAQRDAAIDARLKAFEDSPALKSSGFISMDGGSADKEVKSFADWLLAVKRRDTKRLTTVYKSAWTVFDGEGRAVKDMGEGSGPAGGYLVPVEYEPQLQRISAEAAIVEPRARKITMGSATKMVPMLKQTANPSTADGGSAFFGGLVFSWNPEGADISADKTDPLWDMIELIARKLTGLTVSSNELIEDAPSMESELTQLFGEGLAHAKDFFYLRGNGVGKPLGVLNAPCRYQLTRKASGNNVEIEDVSGLMARMLPGSMSNAIWVSHPLNIADIIQLKIGDTPVFQPDAKGPVAGTLLGRPIAFSEYVPAPGSAGDFGLYDFMSYAVGVRRGITIASSEHARFDEDQTTWRITYRGDGQPLLDATVKLADGSNTEVSPFAVLN